MVSPSKNFYIHTFICTINSIYVTTALVIWKKYFIYLACSRVVRGRPSVQTLHSPLTTFAVILEAWVLSGGIQCRGLAPTPERRNENRNCLIFSSGNPTHNMSRYTYVPLRHDWPQKSNISLIKYIKKIKLNQLHAAFRTQQGRQRELNVNTHRSPLSAKFWRHCVLSGGTQRRTLPTTK